MEQCANCHFTALQLFAVIFHLLCELHKKAVYWFTNYNLQRKKRCLRRFLATFWKSLFWTVHRLSCPCSLWCGMSWNSHHHTWLYHHQGCSITTTRVWNDTSKIDICHPQMGAIMASRSRLRELNKILKVINLNLSLVQGSIT